MSKYPEHAKLKALGGENQKVGHFLEWLNENNLTICEFRQAGFYDNEGKFLAEREKDIDDDDDEVLVCDVDYYHWPEGYYPKRHNTEKWLAQYFGIDQNKLEAEKQQMLADLRG